MDKIICPYCGKSYLKLSGNHLNKHGKTIGDCLAEHPHIARKYYPFVKDKANFWSKKINRQV